MNLIECSAFYNELGDEYKYPKQFMDDKLFDKVTKCLTEYYSTLDIFVCSRPGAGKSTFINGILHTAISRSKKGEESSKRVIRYFHRTLPITFYESPSFSTKDSIEATSELISKIFNVSGKIIKNHIHAVFYIVNGESTRFFMKYEKRILELLLKNRKIPLYILSNRIISKEEREKTKYILFKNIENVIDIKFMEEKIYNNIFYVNIVGYGYSEIDKLFEKMHNYFRKFIMDEEINRINLEQTTQKNCFLPRIKSPKDIIPILQKLCQHISNNFRIRASSIRAEEKGSTYLSSLFLRTINNVFCKDNLSLTTCRNMIKSINFDLDEEIKDSKKEYKSWFKDFFGYKTPVEELKKK